MRFKIKKFYIYLVVYALILCTAVCLYLVRFEDYFKRDIYLEVNGFTRLIIPDTFLYLSVIDGENILQSILAAPVKNTLGPSLIWAIFEFNWYYVALFNMLCSIMVILYVRIILCKYLPEGESSKKTIYFFLIMFSIFFYYSIGSLKEIPSMMLFTLFFYYLLEKKFMVLAVIGFLLFLFRYQMVVLMMVLLVLYMARFRSLRPVVLGLVIICAIYPFFNYLDIFSQETTLQYREEFGVSGSIGSFVETLRGYYGISLLAILFRTMQSYFEPLIIFSQFGIFEGSDISIYSITSVITNFFFIFVALNLAKGIYYLTVGKSKNPDVVLLFAIALVSLISVGGTSFIHSRYFIPFFPILFIASSISSSRSSLKQNLHLDISNGNPGRSGKSSYIGFLRKGDSAPRMTL